MGIRLMPDDNIEKEKAFTSVVEGTILGVVYRTESCSLTLPLEKLKGILHDLYVLLDNDCVTG